jgi:hypothetical protein
LRSGDQRYPARDFDLTAPLDVFDVWEPLDAAFVGVVAKLAAKLKPLYVSWYRTDRAFSYVPYTPETRQMSLLDLVGTERLSIDDALRNDSLTAMGHALVKMSAELRPKTAN